MLNGNSVNLAIVNYTYVSREQSDPIKIHTASQMWKPCHDKVLMEMVSRATPTVFLQAMASLSG